MALKPPPYILTVGFVLALGNTAVERYHQFRFWVQAAKLLFFEVDLNSICIQAFVNACQARSVSGIIFHSDRGSQFTSCAFRESLARYGAIQSMNGMGRCYDNARMESFFATLKKEKLYRLRTERYPMAYMKTVIFRYVMIC